MDRSCDGRYKKQSEISLALPTNDGISKRQDKSSTPRYWAWIYSSHLHNSFTIPYTHCRPSFAYPECGLSESNPLNQVDSAHELYARASSPFNTGQNSSLSCSDGFSAQQPVAWSTTSTLDDGATINPSLFMTADDSLALPSPQDVNANDVTGDLTGFDDNPTAPVFQPLLVSTWSATWPSNQQGAYQNDSQNLTLSSSEESIPTTADLNVDLWGNDLTLLPQNDSLGMVPVPNSVIVSRTPTPIGHACTYPSCTGVFTRDADRTRHEKHVHGSTYGLYLCPVQGCRKSYGPGYSRFDKVTERLRKKHGDLGYVKA
ncbi:hypothetical protein BP6252_01557 [Coleophoma cylindrospora]|uniref:C2H2-type domain-containing protein n=1 Tax=Coleophoma cylindrospora TaxID=1849047 RepID=A0A3D8STA6_9HELO|nr:hypothetical protein BP6252_01557 [Coleophoma cylindrospora]